MDWTLLVKNIFRHVIYRRIFMRKINWIISGLILFVLTMIRVQTAAATAIGLSNGDYQITIAMFGNPHYGNGQLTVNTNQITAFDVGSGDAEWFCTGCAAGFFYPPLDNFVIANGSAVFEIQAKKAVLGSLNPGGEVLTLRDTGVAELETAFTLPHEPIVGTWSYQKLEVATPEPISLTLFGLGAIGLFVRQRRNR